MKKSARKKRGVMTVTEFEKRALIYASLLGEENFKEVIRLIKNYFRKVDQEKESKKREEALKGSKTLTGRLLSNPATLDVLSLDFEYEEGDEGTMLIGTLSVESESGRIEKKVSYEKLLTELFSSDTLEKREKLVLSMRFGYECSEPYTILDTSKTLEISCERVRQIQEQAIRKARKFFSGYHVDHTSLFV